MQIMLEDRKNELVAQAVSGNRYAFQQIVEHEYMLVYRLCYKYCGKREDAEDITQEVFAKLGRSILNFKGESSFNTWLYKLTINCAKDYFRKNSRRKNETAFDESFEIASTDEAQDDILYKKQVLSAITRLPAKLKDAVVLVYSEGLSHAEAGKILGCSESTVSWRVHEARKILTKVKQKVKLFISWLFCL